MTLRAKTYFAAGRRIVRAGDLLPDDDPIIKGREALFETIEEAVAPKPVKKAAPKKAAAVKKAAPKKTED